MPGPARSRRSPTASRNDAPLEKPLPLPSRTSSSRGVKRGCAPLQNLDSPSLRREGAGDRSANIIVVGYGLSGGTAAIAAADAGASVLLLEKMAAGGGCARASTAQLSGACSKLQLKAGVRDLPANHYADCMAIGEYQNNPRLLKIATENAGPMIDWLCEAGAPLYLSVQAAHEAYPTQRTCSIVPEKAIGNGGLNLYAAVTSEVDKRIKSGSIRTAFGARAVKLLRESTGRVTGLQACDKNFTMTEYHCQAVILATGGFSGNPRMMREYNPHLKNVLVFPLLAPFATGDGICLAEDVGAAVTRKGFTTGYPGGIEDPAQPGICSWVANMKSYPGAIWVDRTGRRLANENTSSDTERENAAIRAAGCILYVILDRGIVAGEPKCIVEPNFVTSAWDWKRFEAEAAKGIIVQQGQTIAELAAKTGIDDAALQDTVTRYNSYVAAGKDPDFGRAELKYRLENPPFYAVKTMPRVLSGMPGDGISVNEDMQALDGNGRVVPGLYACGDAIGTAAVSGKHPCAGFALTPAMVFGRIAGRHAASA